MKVCLYLLLVIFLSESSGKRIPLDGDEEDTRPNRRRHHQPPDSVLNPEADPVHSLIPGCTFGDEFYAFEERWHPTLLNFGEMVCVICVCKPFNKDGIFVGKPLCNNIQSNCPEPQCEEPELRPGECCKSCPGEDEQPSISRTRDEYSNSDIITIEDEGDIESITDNTEELYVSLMTNRLSGSRSNGVARATFNLIGDDLFFTILYYRLQSPTEILFTDALNTTLNTVVVDEVHKGKICGEWKNIPSIYLRYLTERLMFVSIKTEQNQQGESEITGRIIHHRALQSESFSTVLLTERKRDPVNPFLGIGGTIIMSVSSSGVSLNYAAMLDGIIESNLEREDDVTVTFELVYKRTVVKSTQTTVTNDMRVVVGVMNDLPKSARKWLGRGRLQMRVLIGGEGGDLFGDIKPYDTCNTLYAVLSGSEAMGRPKATGASGSAVLRIQKDGSISYQVQVAGLSTGVTAITLEANARNTNRRRIIADLLLNNIENGKVSGEYSKPKAKDIQMLMHGELYVNVGTVGYPTSELRGRVKQVHYNPMIASNIDSPVQLSGASSDPPHLTGAAGHAWLVIDEECHLHYQIAIEGMNEGDNSRTMYAEIGIIGDERRDSRLALSAFTGDVTSGMEEEINAALLQKMNNGEAYIQVSTQSRRGAQIRGTVMIPNKRRCFEGRIQPDETSSFIDNTVHVVGIENRADSCFFERRYRASGNAVWAPDYDPTCTTCRCQKRVVICDPVVCPVLTCDNPVKLEDECCPTCPIEDSDASSATETCYYEGDRKNHRVGTQWHPYVIPFGYIKCAICTCLPGGITDCQSRKCPVLNCPKPIRISPDDCCRVCPEETHIDVFLQGDEVERGCTMQEEFYHHGDEWHPGGLPSDIQNCIKCRCKNGQAICRRKQCPVLTCTKKIQRKDGCCPKCADDDGTEVSVSSSSSRITDSLTSVKESRPPKRKT